MMDKDVVDVEKGQPPAAAGGGGERPSINDESKVDEEEVYHCKEDDGDEEEMEVLQDQCLRAQRRLFYLALPFSIVACGFACAYGSIYVNAQYYTPGQWQYCIVYNSAKATIQQNFAISASSYGGQAFIFMGLGFKAGHLALHDLDLLPYGLVVTSFTLVGQLVYRSVNPVIPAITEMTPTLLSLSRYIGDHMYDDVPPSPSSPPSVPAGEYCQQAVRMNRCFLAFQYLVLLCNAANLLVQVYALLRTTALRHRDNNNPPPPLPPSSPLRYHRLALSIVTLSFTCYVIAISAKEDAAQHTLHIMSSFGVAYLFPFVRSSLDVIGLFMLITVASVVYGACKQDPEPYRWAAFSAYIHVLLSYPIITGNFQSFSLYNFWETGDALSPTDPSCTWFLQNDKVHSGGSNRAYLFQWAAKNSRRAEEAICRDAKVSLLAQLMQFTFMHLAVVACLVVVLANWRLQAHPHKPPPSPQAPRDSTTTGTSGGHRPSLISPLLPTSDHPHDEEDHGDDDEEARRADYHHHNRQRQRSMRRSRASSGGHGSVGSGGGGGRARTPSSFSSSSSSSVHDHLLGPVLD